MKSKNKKRLKWGNAIEIAIFQTRQIVTKQYQEYTKHTGLTPRQHLLLANIQKYHNSNITLLTKKTNIDKSSVAVLADKLKDKGFIEINVQDLDKRNRNLKITPEGQNSLEIYEIQALKVEKKIRAVMPKGEAKQLLQNLKTLIKTFNKNK